jgi:hypothetical protein
MNGDTLPANNQMLPESQDLMIVLGAILLVVLIVFFCVLLFRKDWKRQHRHHQRHHRKSYREQFQTTTSGIKELIRQRRHWHRRENRPVNPTLAQTGGLPPIRKTDEPPPPASQP